MLKWAAAFLLANLGLGVYLASQPQPPAPLPAEPLRLVGEERIRLLHEPGAKPAVQLAAVRQVANPQVIETGLVGAGGEPKKVQTDELVDELTDELEEAPLELAIETSMEAVKECRLWGPVLDVHEFDDLRTDLTAAGTMSSILPETQTVAVSYVVYVTGLDDRAAVAAAEAELQARNIDFFVLRRDPPAAISVGLFSGLENAQRTRRQVQALGYEVALDERVKERTAYHLQAFVSPEDPWFSESNSSCEIIAQGG